jgi:hypothetical protein
METDLPVRQEIFSDAIAIQKVQEFQKRLNNIPVATEIQTNKAANNTKYIPISFLEMKLDEIFLGLWSTKNFQSKTIANEEVGSLELWYFHPEAKTWLCRIGVGGVMIQFKKDAPINDLSQKIKNTLSKDYPHLKAECFRNACLSIGKQFGRDLNREYIDTFEAEYENPELEELRSLLNIRLKEFDNHDGLKKMMLAIRDEFIKKGLSQKEVETKIKSELTELKNVK